MSPYYDRDRIPLRVQTVVYRADPAGVVRAMRHLARAVHLARARDVVSDVEVVIGDGSPTPVFGPSELKALHDAAGTEMSVRVEVFGQNLGTARGHNTLFASCKQAFVLVMNPDVLLAPDCLIELFRPFKLQYAGLVEARQMPIEHPKDYDKSTGDTSWASTACALIPSVLMRQLNGFDADSFFLYCDDVDFSWRVRLAGRKVVFQPSAVVFHDKRLGNAAEWESSEAERYFSAEAALFLAHKYSRPDLVKRILQDFKASDEPHFGKAAKSFLTRKKKGTLCQPIDQDHRVAEFVQGEYANHRFKL